MKRSFLGIVSAAAIALAAGSAMADSSPTATDNACLAAATGKTDTAWCLAMSPDADAKHRASMMLAMADDADHESRIRAAHPVTPD